MALVTFQPTTTGPLTGTLLINSNDGGAPVSLALAGTGFDFTIAAVGNTSISVVQGQTAYYLISLTTLGGATAQSGFQYSFQCANLPPNALCVFNPAQLAVLPTGVTGNVQLGIGTGSPSADFDGPRNGRHGSLALVFLALALLPGWRRRRVALRLPMLALTLVGLATGLNSCATSSGSTPQVSAGGGTPPSSYPVTVTASANQVQHSLTVTLIVN
jgi:MYXO-CTERM domain-containing protein